MPFLSLNQQHQSTEGLLHVVNMYNKHKMFKLFVLVETGHCGWLGLTSRSTVILGSGGSNTVVNKSGGDTNAVQVFASPVDCSYESFLQSDVRWMHKCCSVTSSYHASNSPKIVWLWISCSYLMQAAKHYSPKILKPSDITVKTLKVMWYLTVNVCEQNAVIILHTHAKQLGETTQNAVGMRTHAIFGRS